jgi:Bacterial Ig-like domain (group 3)
MVPSLAAAAPAAAATATTYNYSPNYQSFTVPAGETSLHIVMAGGSGANGQGSYGGGPGAPGGEVTGDLAVTPGEVLTLWVGGAGQPGGGQGYGNPTHDDFEGGAGGSGYGVGTGNGGGGGAASYLKANGKILMLGGGGGGGGGYVTCDPGPVFCFSAGGGGGGGGDMSYGGGGGAGGNSFADPSLTGVTFGKSGFSPGTAGQITITYGMATSTTLTSVTGGAHPGQPVTFHAFVDPTDGGGTVTFASDGTTISGCASLPFTSGAGTDWEVCCTTSSLPAGSHTITATYSGDNSYAGSSASTTETITKYATSTSLTASPSDIRVNTPMTLTADVHQSDGGGSVTFTTGGGTPLPGCSDVPLTASGSADQATCTRSWPQAGSYTVVASYSGDAAYDGSAGSAIVTVSQAATKTGLTLSSAGVVYGHEQAEQVSVTVSPQYGGTPAGTVTVGSGSATVCMITLASGSGSCTLPATGLPPGTAQLTAAYNGSADFAASTSPAAALTVAKAASKSTLSLSAARVTYGHEQAEHLTVTVTPQYSGTPSGKVTIKAGTATICTITLASGKGSCTLTARQLRVGTYTLAASYPGSSDFTSSTSARKTLTVVR